MAAPLKPSRGRPRDDSLPERRREQILEAATVVFARDGYPKTDVQAIADRVAVSKGTVYHYFPSKQELFFAAVDRGLRRMHEAVTTAGAAAADPLERMATAVRAYLAFFKAHPELVELLIQERAEFRDREKSVYFEHRDARIGPWRGQLQNLIAAGRLRDVPVERIVDVAGDLVYGTMFTNHFAGRHKPHEAQAEDILDVLFHGILSDSERRAAAASRTKESALMAADQDKTTTTPPPPAEVPPAVVPPPPRPNRLRRWLFLGAAVAALTAAVVFGVPWVRHYLTHVSTDDAYVNGHVTYVAPRVTGVVEEVFADDNQYVEAGALLVRLDDKPYRVAVDERRAALAQARLTVDGQSAALEQARAELDQARAAARAQLAGLQGSWYLLSTVQDLVRYQIASIRASAATLKLQQANLALARKEHDRQRVLTVGQAGSQDDLDQRVAALQVAREQVSAADQAVRQSRVMLGLAPTADDLESVPDNLPETFPGVLYAVCGGVQTLAQLGVSFDPAKMNPAGLGERVESLKPDAVIDQSPGVQAAQAHVRQAQAALGGRDYSPDQPYDHPAVVRAQKELEEAELQLQYTEIRAPIAGFVSRRTVNPGTHVQPGQNLLAVRPLQDVWIDANFKETQLGDLYIGQPVDLRVDAYPGKTFHGRVAGFSPGTGAAMSLLPPENATGNFVKVLQRLTVRIELTEPNPRDTPLFVGLSVTPEVDITAAPADGKRERLLQTAPK